MPSINVGKDYLVQLPEDISIHSVKSIQLKIEIDEGNCKRSEKLMYINPNFMEE